MDVKKKLRIMNQCPFQKTLHVHMLFVIFVCFPQGIPFNHHLWLNLGKAFNHHFSSIIPIQLPCFHLVGGLEHVLFSPIAGMMIQSDELHHFSEGLKPPTR